MEASDYVKSDITAEQARAVDLGHARLTAATRALMDAQLRTEVPLDVIDEVAAQIEEITGRLLKQALPGPFGIQVGPEGTLRNHGNTVTGLRNPFSFFRDIQHDPSGRAWVNFHLNGLYEGPPGLVHGGVSALLLDQLCGEAAGAGGVPGMTAKFDLKYRRPTPLGNLYAEAWVDSNVEYKTIVKGHIKDPEGNVTVEVEGLFILPRWAREGSGWPHRPQTFE
jgi:acyl-coenzyme A thioesterase PaaI-like protein